MHKYAREDAKFTKIIQGNVNNVTQKSESKSKITKNYDSHLVLSKVPSISLTRSLFQHTRCDATKNPSYYARSLAQTSDENSGANSKCNALSVLVLGNINMRKQLVIVLEPATG